MCCNSELFLGLWTALLVDFLQLLPASGRPIYVCFQDCVTVLKGFRKVSWHMCNFAVLTDK